MLGKFFAKILKSIVLMCVVSAAGYYVIYNYILTDEQRNTAKVFNDQKMNLLNGDPDALINIMQALQKGQTRRPAQQGRAQSRPGTSQNELNYLLGNVTSIESASKEELQHYKKTMMDLMAKSGSVNYQDLEELLKSSTSTSANNVNGEHEIFESGSNTIQYSSPESLQQSSPKTKNIRLSEYRKYAPYFIFAIGGLICMFVFRGNKEWKGKDEYVNNTDVFNKDLKNKITNLTKQIDSMNIVSEKTSQERSEPHKLNYNSIKNDQFLSNISYEFKTSLAVITTSANKLMENNSFSSEQADEVGTIKRTGVRLLGIIDDVLELHKVDSGKIKLKKDIILLSELCDEIKDSIGSKFDNGEELFGLKYVYPLPNSITGDTTRIKQIIMNLCSNAMKYTDKGSVELKLQYNKNAQILIVTVKDSGKGIPGSQHKAVFDSFVKIDNNSSGKYSGTGFGLPIARKLCQVMGGDLVLKESALHNGSTFTATIKVPLAENSEMCDSF